MTKIIENKIQCKKCKEIIESKTRHDAVWCSCGSVGVDGGHFYAKRMFKDSEDDYIELLVEEEIDED